MYGVLFYHSLPVPSVNNKIVDEVQNSIVFLVSFCFLLLTFTYSRGLGPSLPGLFCPFYF